MHEYLPSVLCNIINDYKKSLCECTGPFVIVHAEMHVISTYAEEYVETSRYYHFHTRQENGSIVYYNADITCLLTYSGHVYQDTGRPIIERPDNDYEVGDLYLTLDKDHKYLVPCYLETNIEYIQESFR